MTSAQAAPRGPVLDWAAFSGSRLAGGPAVDDAPHRLLTTSGRAALFLALKTLRLAPGTPVLVPTYHCPTMVAPIVHAGLQPAFYAIDDASLPALGAIDPALASQAGAMIVPHLFGRPRSLAAVRAWCDRFNIALIEDCAHAFFGQAGERPVGAWGDMAIASITKFFAVPEAGLLVSHHRALHAHRLPRQGVLAEIKGAVHLVSQAVAADRLRGLGWAIRAASALRPARAPSAAPGADTSGPAGDPLQGCDMNRAELAPLQVAKLVFRCTPRGRCVRRRRENHERLSRRLSGLAGSRVLLGAAEQDAPYALPLWVKDADRVYMALRARGMAVFRWDYCWHDTPQLEGDSGALWRHHVLQLLCHQDLHPAEIDRLADAVCELLGAPEDRAATQRAASRLMS